MYSRSYVLGLTIVVTLGSGSLSLSLCPSCVIAWTRILAFCICRQTRHNAVDLVLTYRHSHLLYSTTCLLLFNFSNNRREWQNLEELFKRCFEPSTLSWRPRPSDSGIFSGISLVVHR